MTIQIVSPRVGWCREATLQHWLVDDGEWTVEGQPICLLKTEHSLVPILALKDGFFRARRPMAPTGTRLTWRTPLGYLLVPGAEPPSARPPAAPTVPPRVPCRVEPPSLSESERLRLPGRGPRISPRARRLARSKGLDISTLSGTGPGRRIRERDVQLALPKVGSQSGAGRPSEIAGSQLSTASAAAAAPAGRHQFEGTLELIRTEAPASGSPLDASDSLEISALPAPRPLGSAGSDRLLWGVVRTLIRRPLGRGGAGSGTGSRSSLPVGIHLVHGPPDDDASMIEPLAESGLRELVLAFPSHKGEPSLAEIQLRLQELPSSTGDDRARRAEFSIIDLAEWPVESFSPPLTAKMVAALSVGAPKVQAIPVSGKLQLRWTRRLVFVTDATRMDFASSLRFFRDLMFALRERPSSNAPPPTSST